MMNIHGFLFFKETMLQSLQSNENSTHTTLMRYTICYLIEIQSQQAVYTVKIPYIRKFFQSSGIYMDGNKMNIIFDSGCTMAVTLHREHFVGGIHPVTKTMQVLGLKLRQWVKDKWNVALWMYMGSSRWYNSKHD